MRTRQLGGTPSQAVIACAASESHQGLSVRHLGHLGTSVTRAEMTVIPAIALGRR